MKTCSKCGISKPLDQFPRHSRSKDGRQSWCTMCHADYRDARRDELAERERKRHWDNRDRILARKRQYGRDHADEVLARRKRWMEGEPLYGTWTMMVHRCENPQNRQFKDYGGRGIKICPDWRDYRVFVSDIERLIGPRPEGRYPSGRPRWTLDRVDNDQDYEPGNVRWATAQEQTENRRPGSHSVDHAIANAPGTHMWCPLCGEPMALSKFAEHRKQEHPATVA